MRLGPLGTLWDVLEMRNGRGDRIRTCDILLPKQARYRAAPLPDPSLVDGIQLKPDLVPDLGNGGPGRIRTRDLAVMSGQL